MLILRYIIISHVMIWYVVMYYVMICYVMMWYDMMCHYKICYDMSSYDMLYFTSYYAYIHVINFINTIIKIYDLFLDQQNHIYTYIFCDLLFSFVNIIQ